MADATTVILAAAGVVGTLGYLAYVVITHSQRARDQVVNDLKRRVDSLETDHEACRERLSGLRDELHSDYVKHGDLRELQRELKDDFKAIFERLNGISREISSMGGRFDAHERNGQ